MQQRLPTTEKHKHIRNSLYLHIDSATYIIEGRWQIHINLNDDETRLERLRLSFSHWIGVDNTNYLIHPDDVQYTRNAIEALLKGTPVGYTLRIITPSGYVQIITGAATFARATDENDNRNSSAMWIKDSLQRKMLVHARQREHELITRPWSDKAGNASPADVAGIEARQRLFFETLKDGLACCQVLRNAEGSVIDWRFTDANPVIGRQMGVYPASLAGRRFSETPASQKKWWIDTAARVVNTQRTEYLEVYNKKVNRWHDVTVSPCGHEQFTILCHDITQHKEIEETLRQERERKSWLLNLHDTLSALSDPVEIQHEAVRIIAISLRCDRGYYMEISDDEIALTIRRDYVRGNIPSVAGIYRASDFAQIMELSRDGCVAINDTRTSSLLSAGEQVIFENLQIRALLFTGVFKNGKRVANIAVDRTTPRIWTSSDIALIQEAAERTWIAIERATNEKALRRSEEEIRTLFNAVEDVLQGEDTKRQHNAADPDASQRGHPPKKETGSIIDQVRTMHSLYKRNMELERRMEERTAELEESKHATERVRTNLHKVLNAIPQMIWILDRDGKVQFVNDRWHMYTGITEDQCVERDARRCDIFHPGQKKEITDKWDYVATHRERYVGEVMIKNQAGDYSWHLDITEPILGDDGKVEMWLGSFINVHEQFMSEKEAKESRDLLQAVFDASTNAIAVFDTVYDDSGTIIDFETLYFNKYATVCFNERDLTKKSLLQLFKTHDTAALFERFKNVIATGAPFDLTYKSTLADKEKWFHLVCIKLADGLVITQNDISAQIKAQQELMQLNKSLNDKNQELKTVNEELTNFTFVASHDLREPLRKIHLFLSDILEHDNEKLSERSKLFSNRILMAVQRMNDLIEDILTYSRVASQPRREHTEADLNKLIEQVVTELAENIRQTGAKITVNKMPAFKCNALQISQLLENLISNALKFQTGKRRPEVSITGEIITGDTIDSPQVNARSNYLKLQVIDNGIGFDTKHAERIFGIFQRLHSHGAYSGLGIGLAICKKVVENHHGFIIAKGSEGDGAVFTCYFPTDEKSVAQSINR